ncbi:cytochrome c oxidase subunit 6C [Neodiprion fabricii]|uniref:cytochrome c oxidase subunit 6C n=1 Tax=Neodiprion fabricii TaxID=2872261 RepID=UPI001ED906E8|nr:cytochrome c oxidase subunit 6C [Neodiprion fabricii]XP_046413488.1 cytochrome c oxidase subunit 6C [Neodiprion fabricii]
MAAAKPQLRGLLATSMKKHGIMTLIVGLGTAFAFKFLYADPKKQRYADFYKTYDADKAFQVMRNAGLLQSVGPE